MSVTIEEVKKLQKKFEAMILDAVQCFEALSGMKVDNMQMVDRDGKRDVIVSASLGE